MSRGLEDWSRWSNPTPVNPGPHAHRRTPRPARCSANRTDAAGDDIGSGGTDATAVSPAPGAPVLVTIPWHPDGSGPVPTAAGPVTRRWRKIAIRTLSKSWEDSLFGMSSQAAFWSAMSTAPFLLALLGLSGFFARWLFGPDGTTAIRTQAMEFLNTVFNEEVANDLLGSTIDTILDTDTSQVVSVGLIISLWAGSSAISAFIEAITIAYCQHEVRHPVLERLFALGLYVMALSAEIVIVPLLAIGPDQIPLMFPESVRPAVNLVMGYVYYPGLALGLILLVTILYKVAPKRKHAFYRGLPGAALAAAVFLVAGTGLRLYVSYVYSHGLTYGALATPITFLLFYYFISMAIIIGAQFNNALLEYYPPVAKPNKHHSPSPAPVS